MNTRTPFWRIVALAALVLAVAPWATAQERVSRDARVESTEASATFLGLPTTLAAAPPVIEMLTPGTLPNEGFTSTTFPPSGWLVFKDDGVAAGNATWVRQTTAPCSSANPCARSRWEDAGPTRRFLATPAITPSAGALLTFRAGQSFTDPYDSVLKVVVSTDVSATPNPATYTTVLWERNESQLPINSFGSYSVDLSSYAGTPIRIAFLHEQSDGDTIVLDDVAVSAPIPAAFASTTLQFQFTGNAPRGIEQWIVAANIVVSGNSGSVPLTSITFDTQGTTDPADLANARLLYSGSNTSFNYQTTPQFGATIDGPSGAMTFTGSQALMPGNNYFILVMRPTATATAGNLIDATYTEAVVSGVARTPTATTVAGAATIVIPPPFDNIQDAGIVTSGSFLSTTTNVNGTAQAGETLPTCGGTSQANSIWYRYTPGTTGTATFDLWGSSFDTVLSIWTGSAFPLTQVGCNDDRGTAEGGGSTSLLRNVAVTGGTTYWIRVSGWQNASGTVRLAVAGPNPNYAFSVLNPTTASKPVVLGGKIAFKWVNPDPAPARVVVYLKTGFDAPIELYRGRARASFAYTVPMDAAPGTTYQFVVVDENNPLAFASSEYFTVIDPTQVFVVTSPVAKQQFAIGATRTVTWLSPSNAPVGNVRVSIFDKTTNTEQAFLVTANDGSEPIAIPSSLPVGNYYIRVASVANGAYRGQSATFKLTVADITSPTASTTWTQGQEVTINWASPTITNPASYAVVSLRNKVLGLNIRLTPREGAPNTGSYTFTLPASMVTSGDYYAQVIVYEEPGNPVKYVAKSPLFSVSGTGVAPEAPVAFRYVEAPVGVGTDAMDVELRTALPDGTEIAAFAHGMVVGAGIVEAGVARMVVHGTVADRELLADGLTAEESAITVENGTPLAFRAFTNGTQTVLDLGEVLFADGDDLVLGEAMATAADADVFALTGIAPNPTAGAATVRFSMPEAQPARVVVYDVLGREVAVLFDGEAQAGRNEVSTASARLNAGVYVIRVSTTDAQATARFTVVR